MTTVFGNATVAAANICRIPELAGLACVPVVASVAAPLDGAFVHEAGGHDPPLPASGPVDEPAVDFMVRNVAATTGLLLVAAGPLTSIARVLTSFPGPR